MRRLVLILTALFVMSPALALAQVNDLDTWIDTDFDGLPANTAQDLAVGVRDSFDIYVDLTGFPAATWTNFLYSFSIGPGPDSTTNWFDKDSIMVNYNFTGISTFPINNFEQPYIIQLGGTGSAQTGGISGPYRLATVTVKPILAAAAGSACITPRIASDNPSYLITQFGNVSDYGTFDNGTRTPGCYTITGASAADATSWGKLKGLYK